MKTFKFIAALCGLAALACGCEKEETKTEEEVKEPVKVETVTLDKSSLNLVEEQEALLVATFSPAEAEVGTVVWASSNDKWRQFLRKARSAPWLRERLLYPLLPVT